MLGRQNGQKEAFSRSVVQSFSRSVVQSFSRSVVQSFSRSIVMLGMVGFLAACQSSSITAPEIILKPEVIVRQLSPQIVLDEPATFEVKISSPTVGAVSLGFSVGAYADASSPVTIDFTQASTKTVEFKITPRQVTPINLIVGVKAVEWSDKKQLRLSVLESYNSVQAQTTRQTKFSSLAEFSRTLEKARLAKKRTQPLEAEITSSNITSQNTDASLQAKTVQYLYNTGATPIDAAQLDEPTPVQSQSSIKSQGQLNPQGWGCGWGPIETVRFLIRNRPDALPTYAGVTSLNDNTDSDFMAGVEYDYPGAYPVRKAKVIVYDNNGAWRNVIAEGYLDDTGRFSYYAPTCDTGLFFDWSAYDPQYEVITESPTHVVTNWVQLQSPRLVTGTYWDQPSQNRTIVLNANDGEATRYMWTLNLTQYAQDFLGNGTKVNVRMNPIGTFAPIGQVFLHSDEWDSLFPLIHEIGHNTMYAKAYSSFRYIDCIGQFIPCIPDFAPLITVGCPSTQNTEANLTSCTTYLNSGFAHIPQNYTNFYAANEGWAQATHMLFVQYFNTLTNRTNANSLPFKISVDSRNCTDPSPSTTYCLYPTLLRSTNEYFMATLFYRLITEFVADWSVQGYQTLTPAVAAVQQARTAWREIQDFAVPLGNTAKIGSSYFVRRILTNFQNKLTVEATRTKVCNILKDTGMTNAELADFNVTTPTVLFVCQR
jgi:hypothetical protein